VRRPLQAVTNGFWILVFSSIFLRANTCSLLLLSRYSFYPFFSAIGNMWCFRGEILYVFHAVKIISDYFGLRSTIWRFSSLLILYFSKFFIFSSKVDFSLPSNLVCIPIVSAWHDCGTDNTDEIWKWKLMCRFSTCSCSALFFYYFVWEYGRLSVTAVSYKTALFELAFIDSISCIQISFKNKVAVFALLLGYCSTRQWE
jgi:hypothetical protein